MPRPVEARCVLCGRSHGCAGVVYTCESCGGTLDLLYDYEGISKDRARSIMAMASGLSPLDKSFEESPHLGFTPLLRAPRLGAKLGARRLLLKDETRHLSGSLKDRASDVVLGRARELGLSTVACASTGNAAASLAALAARYGMEAVVFAPRAAPRAKLMQIRIHGARLYLVDGSYDLAYDLCLQAVRERGWYSRCTGHNPYCGEGKKSVAIDIILQSTPVPPDVVLVPAGDGCILGGVHKGFRDLQRFGHMEKIPRLVAVQAEGSAAIHDAWRQDREIQPVRARTLADSIAVDLPKDGAKALRALRETNGFAVTVSDAQILEAVRDLAMLEGVFAEPAGAAPIAGLRKAVIAGLIDPDACVVALVTGHGLKDRDAAAPLLPEAPIISSLAELP